MVGEKMRKPKDAEEKRRKAIKTSKGNARAFNPAGILEGLDCFEQVRQMAESGCYTRDIVAFIHDSGELTHVSTKALSYKVQRFKDGLLSDVGIRKEEDVFTDDTKRLNRDDPSSIGHALKDLFFNMYDRVKMETETELKLKKLFKGTHKEFTVSFTIGEKLVKMLKELDMLDSGIVEMTRTADGYHGKTKLDSVMAKPESRHKVLGIIDLMMSNPEMFKNVSTLDSARARAKDKKRRPKKKKKQNINTGFDEDQKKAQ